MTIPLVLERAINWPSPIGLVATLSVAAVLIVVGAVLHLRGRARWWAHCLGALGSAALLVVLLDVCLQKVRQEQGEGVTVTRARFTEKTRMLAWSGLIGLPALGAALLLSVWAAKQRRLRRLVPHQVKAGRMHYVQKEYEAALLDFNHAIAIAPYHAEAYCGRGLVHQAMGHAEPALADFERAIRCDPRLSVAYIHSGKIRTETGDLEAALADFGKALVMRPTDPELYLNRGVCLVKKGQVHEAAADFHRVLKLTNHSDFAEPAKRYLHDLEGRPQPPPRRAASDNGAPGSPATPQAQPRPEDFVR